MNKVTVHNKEKKLLHDSISYYISKLHYITSPLHYITFLKGYDYIKTYTYITYCAVSCSCDNYSTWNGFANKMLIRCWFSVYRNVRGREGNFLFSAKYCVFCIPREKSLAIRK